MSREPGRQARIARSFGAAEGYERHAEAQARVARALAAALPADAFASRPAPLVLEIGCGTGLFSRALAARLPAGARLLCTDLAEAMVRRTRASLTDPAAARAVPDVAPRPERREGGPAPALAFAVMDAEAPAVRPPFDLAASSMALQWTADLKTTLHGLAALLRPGGLLLAAVPGRESFRRWRAAAGRLGLPGGLPLPSRAQWAASFPAGQTTVWEERFEVRHADALDFFRSLKGLGAAVSVEGARPADLSAFRRLLREMDGTGTPFAMDYQALYALHVKGGAPREEQP